MPAKKNMGNYNSGRNNGNQNRVYRVNTTRNTGSAHGPSAKNSRRVSATRDFSGAPGTGRGIINTKKEAKKADKQTRSLIRHQEKALIKAEEEMQWQAQVERVHGGVDKIMLSIVVLLIALGALMVYSASYPTGLSKFGDSFYYFKKHLIFIAIGAVGMLTATFIPYRFYKKGGAIIIYIIAALLLVAVLFIGTNEGEAKRWIYIGSFSIQPSEIMKVALVLMLAWYIDKYKKDVDSRLGFRNSFLKSAFFPLCIVGFACVLVLLEKHLSGTLILGIIGILVMLVGGCNPKYSIITTAIVGSAGIGFFLATNEYAWKRVTSFLDKDVDVLNEGWQTAQGVLAIGSGGLFGVGFSESRQKFGYVSMAHNDFIFTIWCEELGFIGAVLLVGLFVAFMWRGYVIAMRAPDTFSMLAVFGITTQVVLQAFLNMMVVCDIIFNTGVSLPFFSYGGSSLIMLMTEMGIILSVSRQYYRKKSIV